MSDKSDNVIRIKPNHYTHIVDNNTNVTRVLIGPATYTRSEQEKVLMAPREMVMIAPRHYAVIQNPVVITVGTDGKSQPVLDANGNYKLRFGDEEIRLEQDPFPLYPGEKLVSSVSPLQVVPVDAALRLKCMRDFDDIDPTSGKPVKRDAGDEWLFRGPNTYVPRIEVQVAELIKATIVKENQALKIRAQENCVDQQGTARRAGDEWLVRQQGAYIPGVYERIVQTVSATTLTEKKALHLRALRSFTDHRGNPRKAGDEWLVTLKDTESHIPDVDEEFVGEVQLTTLSNRQYCVVVDPIDPATGKNSWGRRELRRGETSFFLQPGERLEKAVQQVDVLAAEEALLLSAREQFADAANGGKVRKPGDRWMVVGPCEYTPTVEQEVLERREAIPLGENEGVYVRNLDTGIVRAEIGRSYMLQPDEALWEKELQPAVEETLATARGGSKSRTKTRVVSYRAPHNSAVQVFDFSTRKTRVVLGPEAIMLQPDEHFTVLNLSGGQPKVQNKIRSLGLLLGPDFMTDLVTVESADHARLKLQLAYNWHFEYDAKDQASLRKLFSVQDFVGDACKTLASRVRAAVARNSFDAFHKNSAEIIRSAVFGDTGNNRFVFTANNLVITNIDIQSVEPVDQRTRDSLVKSVQLAIEITTKSQEAAARHEAERLEQEAKGQMECTKIQDEQKAEENRTVLLRLQAESAALEAMGQAAAEANATKESAAIEGRAAVDQAKQWVEASKVRTKAELAQKSDRQEAEIGHRKAVDELEISKTRELAAIETKKFQQLVLAIGPDTLQAIAVAGPEMKARLLEGLGLSSVLITDGASPVNLFNTSEGLIAGRQ